jgi:hypothetical protein
MYATPVAITDHTDALVNVIKPAGRFADYHTQPFLEAQEFVEHHGTEEYQTLSKGESCPSQLHASQMIVKLNHGMSLSDHPREIQNFSSRTSCRAQRG